MSNWQDRTELHAGFLRSADAFPDRPALRVDGAEVTYADLREQACALAATLDQTRAANGTPLTAVFAYRSGTAFAGVLASLFRGHGYVPLNRTFPVSRTRGMLERSGCTELIVDRDSAEQLPELLDGLERRLTILAPDLEDIDELAGTLAPHRVLGAAALEPARLYEPAAAAGDAVAYLLFTSGSTGVPKGVMVAHRNVRHFVDVMVERYDVREDDRFSQTFDMTFDLSAFDMFVAWERGACLCCLPHAELINPGKFVQREEITVWFSVPSMALFMKRLGSLKPNRFPTVRWALFCGEPLPATIAAGWAEAAPNAIVENLYGPTELTIACTAYRWDPATSPAECRAGVVPIGLPYPGMEAIAVDDSLHEVAPGADGELLLAGPQVTLGYWHDAEKTAAAFVVPPGKSATFYRTGDIVRRPAGGEPMTYVGRVDNQVKVNGFRVELGEIEHELRKASGVDAVVALGWPRNDAGASGVTAFVGDENVDVERLRGAVSEVLPYYMVPREIHALRELPLNANGKFDRGALLRILEGAA